MFLDYEKKGTRKRKLLLAPYLLHKKQRLNACNAVAKDVLRPTVASRKQKTLAISRRDMIGYI